MALPKNEKWDHEAEQAETATDIEKLRLLCRSAQKERQDVALAADSIANMWVESKGSELLAAIKALEKISVSALEVAAAVVGKGSKQ